MQYCRYRMASDLVDGRSVLEVGCGSGMGLPYLAPRVSLIVGGDYTMALLSEARNQVPGVPLARLDAHSLPFLDASFDVVLMLEMVYYLSDPDAAFAECRRVLRPGGALMICLPNRDRPDFNPSAFSFQYPNVPELADLFRRHGFTVRTYGGFPVQATSSRDRALAPVRRFAVRHGLIPRSMRAKAMVKRLLYGPLPRLGAVRDGMAKYDEPVELDPAAGANPDFKNLYAVGRLTASPTGATAALFSGSVRPPALDAARG